MDETKTLIVEIVVAFVLWIAISIVYFVARKVFSDKKRDYGKRMLILGFYIFGSIMIGIFIAIWFYILFGGKL